MTSACVWLLRLLEHQLFTASKEVLGQSNVAKDAPICSSAYVASSQSVVHLMDSMVSSRCTSSSSGVPEERLLPRRCKYYIV